MDSGVSASVDPGIFYDVAGVNAWVDVIPEGSTGRCGVFRFHRWRAGGKRGKTERCDFALANFIITPQKKYRKYALGSWAGF